MSKRFGRNQKRRMREQIQRAERKARLLEAIGERNREIVSETARVLGRHFITLDPATVVVREVDAILGCGWRVPVQKGMASMWESVAEAPDYQTFMEVALPAMYGSVIADELAPHMHFVIQHGTEKAAYTIQKESLLMLGKRDAVRRITEQLAEHLYNGLANSAGERRKA